LATTKGSVARSASWSPQVQLKIGLASLPGLVEDNARAGSQGKRAQ